MHRTIKSEPLVVLLAVMTLTVGCAGGALVDVPDSHPAAELVAGGAADTQGFTEEALALDLAFFCGAGGGPRPWQLCLVHSDGITALVTFGNTGGMVARVTGTGLGRGVLVRLDSGRILGIRREGGAISVSIETGGRVIGSLGGDSFPHDG
jgi:hypothetical protein